MEGEVNARKRDVHLHALELFAFTLATEEGGCAVLDETGLAFAETTDVRGHKVLA